LKTLSSSPSTAKIKGLMILLGMARSMIVLYSASQVVGIKGITPELSLTLGLGWLWTLILLSLPPD
jgi:hypothetical protein